MALKDKTVYTPQGEAWHVRTEEYPPSPALLPQVGGDDNPVAVSRDTLALIKLQTEIHPVHIDGEREGYRTSAGRKIQVELNGQLVRIAPGSILVVS